MTAALLSPAGNNIARLIRRGVSWWIGELRQMMPRHFANLLGKRTESGAVLRIGASDASLLLPDRGRPSRIMIPLTGEQPEEQLRSAIKGTRRGDAVTIALDRALIFETEIELPITAKASLRSILQHQIERLLPLDRAGACFDYRIALRAADAKMLKVRVFVTKAATVERALYLARAADLDPQLIVAADYQGKGGPPVLWQLHSPGYVHRRFRRQLEIAAAVLLLAAYGLYLHRLDRVRDALETRLASAMPTAAAVMTLGEQAARAQAASAFFQKRRNEAPLAALEVLTKLVPTDSWITRLAMRGRAVEITGFSPHASKLVRLVEASPFFEKPLFRSPTTRSPETERERFDLSFEIKAEPGR
jgi:general secretion pathway protein L